MSAQPQAIPRSEQREIKTLAQLTRPQLAARLALLREIEDRLIEQAQQDGAEQFACRGRVKLEGIQLQMALFRRDRAAESGEPIPQVVLEAMALGRRQA